MLVQGRCWWSNSRYHQVHSTPVAKWVSLMATSGTSMLRRGLASTLGFQIFHNWFLGEDDFLYYFWWRAQASFWSWWSRWLWWSLWSRADNHGNVWFSDGNIQTEYVVVLNWIITHLDWSVTCTRERIKKALRSESGWKQISGWCWAFNIFFSGTEFSW